jgi:hypothetical protein
MLLMFVSFVMLYLANHKPTGMIGQMLCDAEGKPSVLRLCALWGFNVAAWVVMRDTLRPEGVDTTVYGIFVGGTFAAPVAGKLIEKWNGVFPWSKT